MMRIQKKKNQWLPNNQTYKIIKNLGCFSNHDCVFPSTSNWGRNPDLQCTINITATQSWGRTLNDPHFLGRTHNWIWPKNTALPKVLHNVSLTHTQQHTNYTKYSHPNHIPSNNSRIPTSLTVIDAHAVTTWVSIVVSRLECVDSSASQA